MSVAELQGYWVDLSGLRFADGLNQTWIQALPLGTYDHPIHGDISVTPDRVRRLVDNFYAKVRVTDLDIDYDHKAFVGKAAGWVRAAEARTDGLWLLVEWTTEAYKSLQEGEYRYFSPEFADTWTDPKTGIEHHDVLFGGGITNRPFMKDIMPINLSEVIKANEGGTLMQPDKLRQMLGLTAEATDAEVDVALATQLSKTDPPVTDPPVVEEKEEQQAPIAASEVSDSVKLDDGTVIKASELVKRLADLEDAHKLSEVRLQLAEFSSGDHVVAPAVIEQMTKILSETPKKLGDQIVDTFRTMVKGGIIQLGEIGHSGGRSTLGEEPSKQFHDLVEAAMKASDGKLTYVDAMEAVSRQQPDLYRAYRKETYLKEDAS